MKPESISDLYNISLPAKNDMSSEECARELTKKIEEFVRKKTMSDKSDNKYREFRNYMVNELGITRQDIEAWTKQSVANEVEKLVGQMNLELLVKQTLERYVNMHIYESKQILRDSIAKELANNFVIGVKEKTTEDAKKMITG